MSIPRGFYIPLLLVGLCFADAKPPQAGGPPILPANFGGWQITTSPQRSKDPAAADPTNAALLKEYGFTDVESANYSRDDGRKLTIKAARFQDTSGAYGAFTFYKSPDMQNEKI